MAATTSNKGQTTTSHHNDTTTSHHHHHHHQPSNGNHNPYRRQRRQIQGERHRQRQQSQAQAQACGNDESNSSDYAAAMPQRNDEEYCKEIARKAVARAALHLGVEGMGADALDVLGDVLISFLERIGRVLASTVEASTRTSAHCNILDALHAAEACTAPAAYQVLLTSRDTEAASSITAAATPGQKPPPIMAQNSAAMMQDCGWEGLAAFLFGKDWLSLPLPVVGTAGLDDSGSTRSVNGTNNGAATSITTTTTTTTTTPGMNNTNTTNSNIYNANGNNNNNNNNNGGKTSSTSPPSTTLPSSSSTTTANTNTTNNTTKPLNRTGVGKQLPPKPPNSAPQGGKAINYTTTGATGKSIPNEGSTSTTTTTTTATSSSPSTTTTKLRKGWNAPYLEHLPLFPTSRHPKANPHRLPQSIGFSFHSLAVEEEACRVDLIGIGGAGKKGHFHSDSMGGETGKNVNAAATAAAGGDGTCASSLSTATTTTAGAGAGGTTESTSTIANTNGKGGGDAMKKGGVGLAPSSSSTATTTSVSNAVAASAEKKADMEARRIPDQIYRNEVTSSFWGTVGSSQYAIRSGQQQDGTDGATTMDGDKMDVDGGTTKLLDGANAKNNDDSPADGGDNLDGSGSAAGNKRRVHFDEHQDGGARKKFKTDGGEGISATCANDSALSSLAMGRSGFASGSGLEEERRRPAYVPPFFPPFPPKYPFGKKSAKGTGISSMVLSAANTPVTDHHSKQLTHLALRKSSTTVETRSSSSIPTAVNSEYDEIGQQAVRSSLVSLGRTVGTAFWGSAWTDNTSESIPDSVSSSGNNRNRNNEFIQSPPLGRASTNKKPDVSVVSLGRASGSRVCRILEGSMDAYQ